MRIKSFNPNEWAWSDGSGRPKSVGQKSRLLRSSITDYSNKVYEYRNKKLFGKLFERVAQYNEWPSSSSIQGPGPMPAPSSEYLRSVSAALERMAQQRNVHETLVANLNQDVVDPEAFRTTGRYSNYELSAADYPSAIESLFRDLSDANLADNIYASYLKSNSPLDAKTRLNLENLGVANLESNQRVEELNLFQTDRQRMREIINLVSSNEAVNPVEKGRALTEAMRIVRRYSESFVPSDIQHLKGTLGKLRGMDRLMRQSVRYKSTLEKASLFQTEVDQMANQLSELMFMAKGDKSTQTKNHANYAATIANSLKKALGNDSSEEKLKRLRTLADRLTYSQDRDLQEIADFLGMGLKPIDKAERNGKRGAYRKAIDSLIEDVDGGNLQSALERFLRDRPARESRLTKEILFEEGAIKAKQSGYTQLMLRRLKSDPGKYAEILSDLGLDVNDPDADKKLVDIVTKRMNLNQDMAGFVGPYAPKSADPVMRKLMPFFPGLTRQQEFSVAAMEAMNTAFVSKTADPQEWIKNAYSGSPTSRAMLQRDLEDAVRLRRIRMSPSDIEPDLSSESIRQEAEELMKGQALKDKDIARYVAENQLNRDARWYRAMQNRSPVYLPNIGEVMVNRAWDQEVYRDKNKTVSKMMVEVGRISHDPKMIFAKTGRDQWQAMIGAMLNSRNESAAIATLKRLSTFDMPAASASQAAIVQDVATNGPKLVLPSTLGAGIKFSWEKQESEVVQTMLNSWVSWLTPDKITKANRDIYEEAFNSMLVATREVMGPKLMDYRQVDTFADEITKNYKPIMSRFFHWMGQEAMDVPGISPRTVNVIDRTISAMRSAGGTLDLNTATDGAVVHNLWQRAREMNSDLRSVSASDFHRVMQMLLSTKYNSLSLSQARYAEEDSPSILDTVGSRDGNPLDEIIRMEERGDLRIRRGTVPGRTPFREGVVNTPWTPREVFRIYRHFSKMDADGNALMTPEDAIERLRTLGATAEDLLYIARRSSMARSAIASIAAGQISEAGIQMGSAEEARLFIEAAQKAGVDLRFDVKDGNRIIGSGPAEELRQGGIRIGAFNFMTEEEKRLNTLSFFTDTIEGDPRNRFGFVSSSSNISGLGAGELPIVALGDFERGILSGRSYREGIDPDASFLNLRSIARGERRGVVLDTEYFNMLDHSELAPTSQLLQVAYHDMENRQFRGAFNIKPRQELLDLVDQRLELYRAVHGEQDFVRFEDVAERLGKTGIDKALAVQQERDIMNAMHFIAKLTPDKEQRDMLDSLFQFERVGSKRMVTGIRDFENAEAIIKGTLAHLSRTGVDESVGLTRTLSAMTNAVAVGQNLTNADFGMLAFTADRLGIGGSDVVKGALAAPRIELEAIARYLYPEGVAEKASWSVENLINILPKSNRIRKAYEAGSHTAMTDVRAESEILKRMMWEMRRRNIDPADIPTFQQGSYFVTEGARDLGLERGIYQMVGAAGSGDQFSFALSRMNADGTFIEIDPVTRRSRGEILTNMQQYGDMVGTIEQAKARMENNLWQEENDRIGHAFSRGLYHVEQLLDAGSDGQMALKTANTLRPIKVFPDYTHRGSQLLALSKDAVERMLREEHSPDMARAGRRLLNARDSYGGSALYSAFAEAESIIRGTAHLTENGETLAQMRSDLLTSLNEGLKERATTRRLNGQYRLPEMAINGTNVTLMIDEANPSRSMWRNVQSVSRLIDLPLESDRKSAATRMIHEHLLGKNLVAPMSQGISSPSVDAMATQAMRRIDRNSTVEAIDYTDLVSQISSMNKQEAIAFRRSMSDRLAGTNAGKAVAANLPASLQQEAFRTAIGELTERNMRVPLPLYTSLPIMGEESGYIVAKGGYAFSPGELVSSIDQTTLDLQEKRSQLRTLSHTLMRRPELRDQYNTLRDEVKGLSDNLYEYLRLGRDNYQGNAELSSLLGMDQVGLNTMIMFGGRDTAGRRIGDLAVGEIEYAMNTLNQSRLRQTPLGERISAELTRLNSEVKSRGLMGRPNLTIAAALGQAAPTRIASPAGLTTPPRLVQPASPVAQATAEATQTLAREMLDQGSGQSQASEYITEKLVRGIEQMRQFMKPKFILPALGGAVLLGAYTLGDRGGVSRPAHNEAPGPDGEYEMDMDELASKPLPPDISMGRQAYVEPNGAGMTVRLRTRGPQDPGQISALVQGAMGNSQGRMSVTVRDDRRSLDRNWLQEQFSSLL